MQSPGWGTDYPQMLFHELRLSGLLSFGSDDLSLPARTLDFRRVGRDSPVGVTLGIEGGVLTP